MSRYLHFLVPNELTFGINRCFFGPIMYTISKMPLQVWKVKAGLEITISVSSNKCTSSGKRRVGQIFSQTSIGCPFFKAAIWTPAIICILVANCSCHRCKQPLLGAITPLWEQLHMKTVLHVQLIVTKQKEAGEDDLAHQVATPTSNTCQPQKGTTAAQGTHSHLLWVRDSSSPASGYSVFRGLDGGLI